MLERIVEGGQWLASAHRKTLSPKEYRHHGSGGDPRLYSFPTQSNAPIFDFSRNFGSRGATIMGGKRKRGEEDLEMDEKREGVQDPHEVIIDQGLTMEKAAVFHLVHCWYQEGTADNVLLFFSLMC